MSTLAAYPRIARRTLHEEVVERLRDMIIEGHLEPGQRINEGALGLQLGVSRTPLREAIKTLTGEGLVEMLPAKGALVRRFDEADLRQILEALKGIEQHGARLTCERAPDAALAGIAAMHDGMMALYATRDRLEYFKLNQAIHTALVAGSGNAVLVEVHGTLQSRIKRLRFVGNEGPRQWAGAVAEHEAMVACLRLRDADGLATMIGRHLDATFERVRPMLVSSNTPAPDRS